MPFLPTVADFSVQRHTNVSFGSVDLFAGSAPKKKKERERIGGLRYFGWSKPGSLSVQRIVYLSEP